MDCFLSWCKIDNVGKLQDNYKQVFLKKMKKYGKNILKKLLRAKMVCRMKQNLEWKTAKARVNCQKHLKNAREDILRDFPTCSNLCQCYQQLHHKIIISTQKMWKPHFNKVTK